MPGKVNDAWRSPEFSPVLGRRPIAPAGGKPAAVGLGGSRAAATLEKMSGVPPERLFRDESGAAIERVARLEDENRKLLRRAAHALRSGGKLFIVEFFLDASRTAPARSAVFSVMMYLYTATGRCYSWSEVQGWLRTLGYGRFKRHRITPAIGMLEATRL